MVSTVPRLRALLTAVLLSVGVAAPAAAEWLPGGRVLLDAHNCYPYHGQWSDRLSRALSVGTPLAIEQDLTWFVDPTTGKGRSLVAHDEENRPNLGLDGSEPTLDAYFFERIRPLVETALRENRRDTWPLITLNLDFKTEEPEHLAAVWALLQTYQPWLTTAPRAATLDEVRPLSVGPVLVLTGESDRQRAVFHDAVPEGQALLVFGAARPERRSPEVKGELPDITAGRRTNYHRWWNNPWSAVERGGQPRADLWTPDDARRLQALVGAAHRASLWIRFYTLNGHDVADESGGWSTGYNFGSSDAAAERWRAAIAAGVDFIATDQYEAFAAVRKASEPLAVVDLDGDLSGADYERLLERPFTVPAGVARVDLTIESTGADERTVIDLGLRGPAGIRGWSGGGPQAVHVGLQRASAGYLPGPIEPGEWAVILGVPNIRADRHDRYHLRIRMFADDARVNHAVRRGAGWFVGDLHAHSGHSDGRVQRDGTRVPAPADRVFEAARRAGLDFIALTDHNTASHWLEVDRLQPYFAPLLLLHGRELTTYRGHANAIGERRLSDFRINRSVDVARMLSAPAHDGAFVAINHPTSPDDERCMGCGWNDTDDATLAQVRGIEVLNGPTRALDGWRFWARLLNRGYRLTAVGGSDDHTPDDATDNHVGQPATVVYAEDLSEEAVVEGLNRGRAYVRVGGPQGPSLSAFDAVTGPFRAAMGGTVPPGRLTLTATVRDAAGAELTWIRRGAPVGAATLDAEGRARLDLTAHDGDWLSVIVRDANGPVLFSNAIYVRR